MCIVRRGAEPRVDVRIRLCLIDSRFYTIVLRRVDILLSMFVWLPYNMETKRELLMATLALVSRRGYENVSIDDIAAATNNTKGAVYHYFHSKDDLYKEALDLLAGHLTSLGSLALDERTSPSESMKRILTALVDGDPTVGTGLSTDDVYYLFFDGMRRFPELKKRFQELTRSYLRSVADRIAGDSADGRRVEALQFLVWVEGIGLIQAITGGLIGKKDIGDMIDRFFA